MTKVPFISLKEQHRAIRGEVRRALDRVFDSQQFILKGAMAELEAKVARFTGTKFAVSVASGSDALYLALWALGVKPGDEVLTTPFTFFASASSISRLGAKPVFADIDEETFNLDPSKLEAKITKRTKAVLPVHLFGLCCDMERINRIARRHGLKVIEDAAQAFGSTFRGRRAGALADAGCFSFYPTKNFGGAGDGGMVTTSLPAVAEKIRLLRNHGSEEKYHHHLIGINSRLDEVQAAVLRVGLRHLAEWTERRRALAGLYFRQLEGAGVTLPREQPYARAVYHLFVIRHPDRDALRAELAKRGVGTLVHYPLPLHLQPAFASLGGRRGQLPVAEKAAEEVLSLPLHPGLGEAQAHAVAGAVRDAVDAVEGGGAA
jgi:dTDP-4-amino-4,6-dideoxygalactose transaminase